MPYAALIYAPALLSPKRLAWCKREVAK